MKPSFNKILYATIKNFELQRRCELDDYSFDAFEFLSKQMGHKNPSTLRKMCELRQEGNGVKLGYEEAITIMQLTKDYRLLKFIIDELRSISDSDQQSQLNLFSQPIRSINETKL